MKELPIIEWLSGNRFDASQLAPTIVVYMNTNVHLRQPSQHVCHIVIMIPISSNPIHETCTYQRIHLGCTSTFH